jgi:hypothetical protein
MEMPIEQEAPESSPSETTSSALLKLVHKLRWAGMDEEAERLLKDFKRKRVAAHNSVLATPNDTD